MISFICDSLWLFLCLLRVIEPDIDWCFFFLWRFWTESSVHRKARLGYDFNADSNSNCHITFRVRQFCPDFLCHDSLSMAEFISLIVIISDVLKPVGDESEFLNKVQSKEVVPFHILKKYLVITLIVSLLVSLHFPLFILNFIRT